MKQIVRWGFISMMVLIIITSIQNIGQCADFERRDVTFKSQGLACVGWYYVPKNLQPAEKRPVIVMANGYSLVKEVGLDQYAEKFAEAGFVVLVFDYRYFGASEGEPRGQLFYYDQIQDYRNAITWASVQKEVDPQRIGVWGISFSGGHVLHLAAFDKRIKAVVAQVPAPNQWETYYQTMKPEVLAQTISWLSQNRVAEYNSGTVNYAPVVAPQGQPSILGAEAYNWFMEATKAAPNWKNKITVESVDINKEYAPMAYIHLIAPTPLLMVIADHDTLCFTEIQKKKFELAGEPKKMVVVKGGHFSTTQGIPFEQASAEATDWFKKYLKP